MLVRKDERVGVRPAPRRVLERYPLDGQNHHARFLAAAEIGEKIRHEAGEAGPPR